MRIRAGNGCGSGRRSPVVIGPAPRRAGSDRADGGAPSPGPPQPRPLAEGVVEAAILAAPGRAVAAARAFAAGNGYLPGQVVDRIV